MNKITICTNNPLVAEKYPKSAVLLACGVGGVFSDVRDRVHKGFPLISHPLSGSIKPNITPYKSVVVSGTKSELCLKSLQIIEDAIDVLKRLPETSHDYNESTLDDFRVIDLDLVNSATGENR